MRPILLNDIEFKVINLKHRTDRRSRVEEHLNSYGMQYEIYDALGPDDSKYANYNISPTCTNGRRGCFLSHYDIIKNHTSDTILGIFEDDVELSTDFLDRFKYIEDTFNLPWDIFFLSSFYHLNNDTKRWNIDKEYEKTDIKYIHRTYGSFCLHSYLINPDSISNIINLIDINKHKSFAIDHLFILLQPQLNCYAFTPGMATQIYNFSDIDQNVKNQQEFEYLCGAHYYADILTDFDYDTYFNNNP